ncbi:MAG: hypothetical protein KDN19_23900, partial [Verrucomicrobiae bacterium]|nr:hypothetical protein [Verrucomicrobiae bacterium]
METSDLRSARYWESEVPDIRLNPVGSLRRQGLADFVRGEARLRGHILVATSGGNDGPKLAAVSRRAFLSSALQVNAWLRVTGSDRWLCALPDFHVGGLGIFARAFTGGCEAFRFTGRWRNREGEFAGLCEDRAITLTALTPTQV